MFGIWTSGLDPSQCLVSASRSWQKLFAAEAARSARCKWPGITERNPSPLIKAGPVRNCLAPGDIPTYLSSYARHRSGSAHLATRNLNKQGDSRSPESHILAQMAHTFIFLISLQGTGLGEGDGDPCRYITPFGTWLLSLCNGFGGKEVMGRTNVFFAFYLF